MTTLDTHEPTAAELAAIDVSAYLPPRRLTREECTTPELRLEYIAQWLEAGGDAVQGHPRFHMQAYGTPSARADNACGTTCCIAGKAIFAFGDIHKSGCTGQAAEILGLTLFDSFALFGLHETHKALHIDDPAHAARCIRKYQRTGIVDWAGTRK